MLDEIKLSYQNFAEAYKRLNEGVAIADNDLYKDGVIQRFEFTFELMWKTLKLFLTDQGIISQSPKETLKAAFRYGLLSEQDVYLEMLEDRNITSHNYNLAKSEQIFNRIKIKYVKQLGELIDELQKRI